MPDVGDILPGDARETLAGVPEASIHLCMTLSLIHI